MKFFREMLARTETYTELVTGIATGQLPIAAYGLSTVHKANTVAAVTHQLKKPAVLLCHDEKTAERLASDINQMEGPGTALVYRQKDYLFHPVEGTSREFEYSRLAALGKLLRGEVRIVVATAAAASQLTMPPEVYAAGSFDLRAGDTVEPAGLAKKLLAAGYVRRDQVDGPGQFSWRGGIFDLFPPGAADPLRIEFWGDEIDTVAAFDLLTQRRQDNAKKVHITPARETIPQDTPKLVKTLRRRAKDEDSQMASDAHRLEEGVELAAIDRYLPLCYEKPATLFDYLPEDGLLFVSEWGDIAAELDGFLWQLTEDVKALFEQGIDLGKHAVYACDKGKMESLIGAAGPIFLEAFTRSLGSFKPKALLDFTAVSASRWSGQMNLLREELDDYLENGYCVLVLGGTEKAAKTLASDLIRDGYRAEYAARPNRLTAKTVYVAPGAVSAGFSYPAVKVAVITYNMQGDGKKRRKSARRKKNAITSVEDITPGDFVVHTSHGIGQFVGVTQMEMQGVKKDYLKIQYRGRDVLFVPVTQLELVGKYIGPREDSRVKLNKLHSTDWQKTKSRVYSSVKEMADELIKLYAERERAKGFAFSEDNDWQKEFEERFEYAETDDQLQSIQEIKEDMQKARPMDRLLCGDVGYGKTEVALRAAFKCVLDSKQCAILVPTTILAWQHYQTIRARLGEFPVKVELLSRFRTPAQQKEALKKLKTGEVDIIVGTHRLLQKDVKFKDLGLAIVDEEQRFGVAHKEKLKELFNGVDMLTLSATPIPRTLNMALSGIRDISIIDQPPQDRHPIQTYVLEHNESVITEAIKKELRRGGQVYYLYNKVQSIEGCAARLREMVPDSIIEVAHGKMGEAELSRVWSRMINGEIDILVCSTIIETGVDVANVNTLVIEDADRLGLSQLYQLRGRVGRSSKRAYSYFTFRRGKVLSEDAAKRLEAIREFTSFGSGFKIAMRDLEIRGAGNILGAQQHGHMEAVGYDMYLRLLSEAVQEKQGGATSYKAKECQVDLQIDAYIPKDYIESLQSRIDIYKKIASITSREEADDLLDEVIDRFSDPPKSVLGLVDVALLRGRAAAVGIEEISQNGNSINLYFENPDMKKVSTLLGAKTGLNDLRFNAHKRPFLSFGLKRGQKPLEAVRTLLGAMEK